jgi:DNA-binding NarL/FixJ family response regulator
MAIDPAALAHLRRAAAALSRQDGRGVARQVIVELGGTDTVMTVRREHENVLAILAPRAGTSPLFDGLTPREREVAALLAAGRTNREIAAALVIAIGTVKDHVHRVLAKTGLRSRAAIAAAWHSDR